ncbi:MAG: hypothetical protein DI598_01350 [Pseudopedobacter saltans]|uniref:TraB/GumN family protein n=1 Tax=Pseudopedobacter saltans TaxID=151895 RepID=A0A2W5FEU4_9SPHI|nr:MAG: hypothetical protein DI598_01350 [Pseudopedobacter saltans]
MKKTLSILLLFITVSIKLSAQNSIFWKISGNGLKQSSYLTGTVHIISKKDFIWTPTMERAMENSQQLCLELPFDSSTTSEYQKYIQLPEGKTLKDFYKTTQYDTLSRYFDSVHFPITFFEKSKPFGLLSMLMYINAGYGVETTACETELMKIAKKDDKALIGLETLQQQMSYIDHQNQDSIAAYAFNIIRNPIANRKLFRDMVTFYKKQDINSLYKFMNSQDMSGFNLSELVDNRNKDWIPKMEKMIHSKATFFAVGAGHLGGEKGILSLLKKQGYRVTPVY